MSLPIGAPWSRRLVRLACMAPVLVLPVQLARLSLVPLARIPVLVTQPIQPVQLSSLSPPVRSFFIAALFFL